MPSEVMMVTGAVVIIFVVAAAAFAMLLRSLGKRQRGKGHLDG